MEYSNQEDAHRAIRELSEHTLLGRPVFIREASVYVVNSVQFLMNVPQDRENESRFGATPVPGKIGMAMAGQGLNAAPPPRPASHNLFGQNAANPGNQLYVGNVNLISVFACELLLSCSWTSAALPSWLARLEGLIPICRKYRSRRHQYRCGWSSQGFWNRDL